MTETTLSTIKLCPTRRIRLHVLLDQELQVALLSNTGRLREVIQGVLALPDGAHSAPEALQELNQTSWWIDLGGSHVQGVDLLHQLNAVLLP
ncbi:hypothetical protein IPG41_06180 [Candidatus Peregrinibacteria bacterium]|nr:MAG: hypothetical protein IPG41_06180 [Candidatus Peregrinibacteria bacterium]